MLADPPIGILLVLALSSIAVYGIMLAGWSSGSKYPLLGAVRASAQMVSYEAALGLSVAAVLLIAGTLTTAGIVAEQDSLANWNIVATGFLPFFVFMIAATAELNRPPFDLVEAEQELVGGFNTEYSSIRFALFFLAEFMNTITMSAIIVTLFLGGPQPISIGDTTLDIPLIPNGWEGTVWFLLKLFVFLYVYVWLRATLPRLRYDQLMDLGWKVLIPIALGWFMLLAAIQVGRDNDWNLVAVVAVSFVVLVVSGALLMAAVTRQRPQPGGKERCSDGLPRRLPCHAPPAPPVRRQAGDHELLRRAGGQEGGARQARRRPTRCAGRHCPTTSKMTKPAAPRPPCPQPVRGRDGEVHRLRAVRRRVPADCIYVRGADNDPDEPTSPGERYGFVYEINYLRCIHCDLCVEACPTEAITESKLFEFSFTNRRDAIYTKTELVVDDDGRPQQLPWEDWREGDDVYTSGWMRATAPSGDADFVGEVGWSASSATACVRPRNRSRIARTRHDGHDTSPPTRSPYVSPRQRRDVERRGRRPSSRRPDGRCA